MHVNNQSIHIIDATAHRIVVSPMMLSFCWRVYPAFPSVSCRHLPITR